jgi:hypothetical protein
MSCPYFYPLEPRTSVGNGQNARLPLGDFWTGQCRAVPLHPCQPDDAALRPLCNLGYARGNCPQFPALPELPDAVRFTIAADQGSLLQLYYVIERDHHPFAHGPLEYSTALGRFSSLPDRENFDRQALAYVESYLRRKTEAGRP